MSDERNINPLYLGIKLNCWKSRIFRRLELEDKKKAEKIIEATKSFSNLLPTSIISCDKINTIPLIFPNHDCKKALVVIIGSEDNLLEGFSKALQSQVRCNHEIIVFHSMKWEAMDWEIIKPSFERLYKKCGKPKLYLKIMGIKDLISLTENKIIEIKRAKLKFPKTEIPIDWCWLAQAISNKKKDWASHNKIRYIRN
ncbi:MAG: hypothetical protein ACXQS8_09610 [Candidatus Helarchaeales archaeon]